jgi:hypothetical protein
VVGLPLERIEGQPAGPGVRGQKADVDAEDFRHHGLSEYVGLSPALPSQDAISSRTERRSAFATALDDGAGEVRAAHPAGFPGADERGDGWLS